MRLQDVPQALLRQFIIPKHWDKVCTELRLRTTLSAHWRLQRD